MRYLLVTAGVFLLDYEIKRYVDRTCVCGESHPWNGISFGRRKVVTRAENSGKGEEREGADGPACVPGRIVIEKYYNKGAALNFLEKHPGRMRAVHTGMLLAAGGLYVLLLRMPGRMLCKTGMALLVGGGAGNLCDRLCKGHVVDYFRIDAGPERFRKIIFNLSDFCIFIGAFLAVAGAEA